MGNLETHAKLHNPTITHPGRKVNRAEKERERKKKKNAVNSGNIVRDGTRKALGPIMYILSILQLAMQAFMLLT